MTVVVLWPVNYCGTGTMTCYYWRIILIIVVLCYLLLQYLLPVTVLWYYSRAILFIQYVLITIVLVKVMIFYWRRGVDDVDDILTLCQFVLRLYVPLLLFYYNVI